MNRSSLLPAVLLASVCLPGSTRAQEPEEWGPGLHFNTFSIAAVDPETGESGVAVTTRVACVGNAVPWVRAGVGAVATQSWTRVEYGPELLDMLEEDIQPGVAMKRALEADTGEARRQVGVVALDGSSAQHTGSAAIPWAGHVSGPNYAVQGNLLVGSEVVHAVAEAFESSAGSGRHLADRLIEALAAGQARGGDARKGRMQSAALLVADPRDGVARRPDGVTVNINVCEHPTPVAEVRRIYDAVSGTLGHRTLSQFSGGDVVQLKIMLHALGYFRPHQELEEGRDLLIYDEEAIAAVERFRESTGLATAELGSPRGLVDRATVSLLWRKLEESGKAREVREGIRDITAIRR